MIEFLLVGLVVPMVRIDDVFEFADTVGDVGELHLSLMQMRVRLVAITGAGLVWCRHCWERVSRLGGLWGRYGVRCDPRKPQLRRTIMKHGRFAWRERMIKRFSSSMVKQATAEEGEGDACTRRGDVIAPVPVLEPTFMSDVQVQIGSCRAELLDVRGAALKWHHNHTP